MISPSVHDVLFLANRPPQTLLHRSEGVAQVQRFYQEAGRQPCAEGGGLRAALEE